jgi:hypothetical protein
VAQHGGELYGGGGERRQYRRPAVTPYTSASGHLGQAPEPEGGLTGWRRAARVILQNLDQYAQNYRADDE